MPPEPSSPDQVTDESSLRRMLDRACRALRFGRGVTALAIGLVVAGLVLGVWLIGDAMMRFGPLGRWVGFLAFVSPLLVALLRAVRAGFRRIDDAALARRLELASGRDDNALVNAVQLDRKLADGSSWRGVLLSELSGMWEGITWQRVYDWHLLRRWAAGVCVLVLSGFAFFSIRPDEFRQRVGRVLMPASEIAPVTRTRVVEISPGNCVVARGTVLSVRVTLAGEVPNEVWMVVAREGGQRERHEARREVEGMVWEVQMACTAGARYWFEAGDVTSFARTITVQVPARVVARSLTAVPPAYTRQQPIHVADGATFPAIPEGSTVEVDWDFDREVRELAVEPDDVRCASMDNSVSWKLAGRPQSRRPWNVRWTDVIGLSDKAQVEFRLKPDEAPRVRLVRPTGEEEVLLTRDSWLRMSFEAVDDYGLAQVELFRGTAQNPKGRVIQAWRPGVPALQESVDIPVSRWVAEDENEAWFCVVATDGNDVTGPGRTQSRVLVVRIVTPDELKRASESRQSDVLGSLDDLLRLQQKNLDDTRALAHGSDTGDIASLAERQLRIQDSAGRLVSGTPAGAAVWRDVLVSLMDKEMPQAVGALRDADAGKGGERDKSLARAEALQTAILARLKKLPNDLRDDTSGAAMRDLIGRVEALFQREQYLHGRVLKAVTGEGASMAADQDALAGEAQAVRKALADGASNASLGDAAFRRALTKAAGLMGEAKIYEQMLVGAEHIEREAFANAAGVCKQVLVDLARVLQLLQTSQRSAAGDKVESIREAAAEMQEKLDALVGQQRAVVEKSRELASKDEFHPEDVAKAKELAAEKAAIEKLIEQMLIDAHAFPDLRPMNELREELTKIFEDVIQQDAEQARAGALKPSEIAVQKEEAMLEALENAAKTAADMEMWLPDKNETTKWLMENFDLTEMPEIPNLPLADAFTDLVGELLEKQEGLEEQVQDAASNNAFAVNPANGWEVADGPMPGFNAQGKSGNTPPNKNEQTGRSSGGREGMSSGEMVNQRADKLEGSSIEARRTNDPLQKGQVIDDGPPADAKATGGGKAGGASQREGMTGEAPLRPVHAPDQMLNDALAAEQALLARQTAKSYATARLFYLQTGPMSEVAMLMDESREALKNGRMAEYQALHRRIVTGLRELGDAPSTGDVIAFEGAGARGVGQKRLPGGADAAVPAGFQQSVDDYYRLLDSP